MKRISNTRGFTLIELLVVIAIVGVLASITMVSVNSAQSRATNNAIRANLNNIRGQALIFFDSNNFTYGTQSTINCAQNNSVFQDPKVTAAIQAVQSLSGYSVRCQGNISTWLIRAQLKSAEGSVAHWCVDDAGNSRGLTQNQVNTMTNTTYVCP